MENCIDLYMYADVIWDIYIYVWENVCETKCLKYQHNIEGNCSFRMLKCENVLSSFAYSYIVLIVSVLSSVYCRL